MVSQPVKTPTFRIRSPYLHIYKLAHFSFFIYVAIGAAYMDFSEVVTSLEEQVKIW